MAAAMGRGGLAVAVALWAAGCGRDLAVPVAKPQPTLDSFAPASAFFGDTVAVRASNLDRSHPENYSVEFPGGLSATPFAVDEQGALLVYVPFDVASEGPLVLVSPYGRSAPSAAPFVYRGHGFPVRGTHVTDLQLRHRTPGLALAPGELFVASQLARSALGSVGSPVPLGGKPVAFTNVAGGLLLAGLDEMAAGPVLLDPATRAVVARGAAAGISQRLLVPGPGGAAALAVAVGEDGGGAHFAQAWVRAGQNLTGTARRLDGLWTAAGAALLPGGRLLVLGRRLDPVSGRLASGGMLVDLASPGSPLGWVAAPEGLEPAGPAALYPPGAPTQLAVALTDGTVALLDGLGTANPTWLPDRIPTGARTPAAALVAVEDGAHAPLLLATLPDAGALVALSVPARASLWAVALRGRPSALTAARGATQSLAFVADDDANGVDVVDLDHQQWLGRVPFDAGIDSPAGCGCAGVAPPSDGNLGSEVWFLARQLRAVLPIDVNLLEPAPPIPLAAAASAPRGLVAGPDARIWVMHERELGVVSRSGEQLVTASDLAVPPTHLAFPSADKVVVGSDQDIALYTRAAGAQTYARTAALRVPATGRLVVLRATAKGEVLGVWAAVDANNELGVIAHAELWTPAALAAGASGTRRALFASDQVRDAQQRPILKGFLGALPQAGGALLFFADVATLHPAGSNAPRAGALLLDAELAAGALRPAPIDETGPILVSEDGRHVAWARRVSGERTLRLAYAGAASASLYDTTTWQLGGDMAAVVSDQTGEWLFVPLLGQDRISVLQ